MTDVLLECAMKPEEIGSTDPLVRDARAKELVAWFRRYARRQANPKWADEHGFELAYAVETLMRERDAAVAALRPFARIARPDVAQGEKIIANEDFVAATRIVYGE